MTDVDLNKKRWAVKQLANRWDMYDMPESLAEATEKAQKLAASQGHKYGIFELVSTVDRVVNNDQFAVQKVG